MQRFYPPRGRSGHGRCVEVSGCEAHQDESTGVAVGFDRALHNYRLHPVSTCTLLLSACASYLRAHEALSYLYSPFEPSPAVSFKTA